MQMSDDLTPAQVKKYLDRRTVDVRALLTAVAARDSAVIREITHRIKGNAALYGFADMGLMAGKIVTEVDAAELDWSSISRLANELAAQVDSELRRME